MDPNAPAGQMTAADLVHCSPAAIEAAEFQYLVTWHAQRGHFQTIERLATAAIRKQQQQGGYGGVSAQGPTGPFTLDATARFWLAFALTSQGRRADALRELNALRPLPHFGLAVVAALITTHKAKDSSGAAAPTADAQEMAWLRDELKQQTRAASDDGFVLAALYFWQTGKIKQAKHCVDKVLERNAGYYPAQVAAGFVYLATGFARHERRAVQYATLAAETFEAQAAAAAASGIFAGAAGAGAGSGGAAGRSLPALLARAAACEQQSPPELNAAMQDLNALIVLWPHFLPGLCDKMRLQVKLGAWEDALSAAARVLAREPGNLTALQTELIAALTQEADTAAVLRRGEALLLALDAQEPAAHALYACAGRALTAWAGGRETVLDVAAVFLSRATAGAPGVSAYHADAGALAAARGDYAAATAVFRDASNLDQVRLTQKQSEISQS